ncbi:hypothetical protein GCM10010294_34170 [Streptomyces griseoloalbus]|nr:hypothetical protein GCM10010294_34170 [Streptomyces griseoloalbus]
MPKPTGDGADMTYGRVIRLDLRTLTGALGRLLTRPPAPHGRGPPLRVAARDDARQHGPRTHAIGGMPSSARSPSS